MGLRDIFLLVTIYGSIPFIYIKPFIGLLVWYWLSLMNPHLISWTLSTQPFAQLIAIVMLSSLLISQQEQKRLPATSITVTLALFWFWMLTTTIFSLFPDRAWTQWDKVWKIMLTTYVAMMMLNTKERVIALTTVAALSIGFYGFKGGYFTILTGGGYKVWGPASSFIGGNNEIGLALIMAIPLLMYVRTIVAYRLLKLALLVGVVLCVFSIVGTQSRGAFVGIAAVGAYFLWKTKNKVVWLILLVPLALTVYNFMPESWHERMASISEYEEDGSAMGRLQAWEMAFNLALDRPFGGGFETFKPATYLMYLPEVGARNTDAHSIYFEVMAEHGFIGLTLFLLIGLFSLRACARIVRRTRGIAELEWMNNLARMMQVSLVGYAVSGLFLGLAYFDFYYALVAIIVGMTTVLKQWEAKSALPYEGASAGRETAAATSKRAPPTGIAVARKQQPRIKALPSPQEAVSLARDWYRRL